MGPSKSVQATQEKLTQQQLDLSQKEFDASQTDKTKRDELLAPAIDFNKAVAGGDKSKAFTAVAPIISQFTAAGKKSKGQINESIGPGVARDVAQAENTMSTRNNIANTLSTTFSQAFDKLANIGSGLGSFSLNEAGASINASQGASQSNQVLAQMQQAPISALLSMFGALAGGAGSALSGSKLFGR